MLEGFSARSIPLDCVFLGPFTLAFVFRKSSFQDGRTGPSASCGGWAVASLLLRQYLCLGHVMKASVDIRSVRCQEQAHPIREAEHPCGLLPLPRWVRLH